MKTRVQDKLFSPIKLGPLTLEHRVVMAPMTRQRANSDDTVSDIMVEHYSQRATRGGLIIIEGSTVSTNGNAYLGSPGIYDDNHIAGYKRIADAVHSKGGYVFAQLFHSGRVSHTSLQPDAQLPVGPSALPFVGHAYTAEGDTPASPTRALEPAEILTIVGDFRKAAERALAAGLDGIELHGANGYLPDQFLQDNSNHRTDEWGGPVENRARLMIEISKAFISVWGPGRVGVRIGPSGTFNGMGDSNPTATFGYLAQQLNKLDLAYLHVIEPRVKGDQDKEGAENDDSVAASQLRKVFTGRIIAAGGFTADSAEEIIQSGNADLVAFGRYFSSNPDLVERLKSDLPLTKYNRSMFYTGTAKGYNDFPYYEQEVNAKTAKVVTFNETGGPEVLQTQDTAVPAPGKNEIRLAVKAIALNRSEAMWRGGQYIERPKFPAKIGYEAAGVVDSIGENVKHLAAGDKVSLLPGFSQADYGTYGQLVLMPAAMAVKYPNSLTFEEASTIWMMFLTAYGALIENAHLEKGDVVLIPAASSGVGLAAIQIANYLGATPVALTRSSAKRQQLLGAGAVHVIVTDEQNLNEEVKRITKNKGADVILDPILGPTFAKFIDAIAHKGRYVIYGALSTQETVMPVINILTKLPVITAYKIFDTTGDPERLKAGVEFTLNGFERGAFKAYVDKVFPFEQIVESHKYLEGNDQFGKIVVSL